MGVFRYCQRVLWPTPKWKASQLFTAHTPQTTVYFEDTTTPGPWRHTWCPIQFCLIFDDFGIKYVGGEHAHHLYQVLQKYYEISEDWKGNKFAGIDLGWNYATKHNDRTCHIKTQGYIERVLL